MSSPCGGRQVFCLPQAKQYVIAGPHSRRSACGKDTPPLRLTVVPHAEFAPSSFAGLQLVRRFYRWDAWSARRNGRLFLILEEYVRLRVTLCEYDSPEEYAADRRVLESLPGVPPRPGSSNSDA